MSDVLAVAAFADRVDADWVIKVIAPRPLVGLFALGDARANLAEVIEIALVEWDPDEFGQLDVALDHIDAIRVFCQTRKTFPLGAADEVSR